MMELLQYPFMQRAVLAALLVGAVSSFYAPFVVQRRMAFMGAGLSHAAFGGVALGLFLDLSPLWVALPFTLLVALGMVWVREETRLAEDTSIGIFFAVSMAIGVVLLAKSPAYSVDAFAYLFGSVLAVQWEDLALGFLGLIICVASVPLWPRWAYATFERNLARSDGIKVTQDDYFLAGSLALIVVISIKLVGIILAAAFMVLPAATARLLSRTFAQMTLFSLLIGISGALGGLALAYYADIPSGAAIVLIQTAAFCLALLVHRVKIAAQH